MTREQMIEKAVRYAIGDGLRFMRDKVAEGVPFERAAWMSPACIQTIKNEFRRLSSEVAGLPTVIITASPRGSLVSVVFGPLPSEPRMGQIETIPISEEDGARSLNELQAMYAAGTLQRRET